MATLFRAPLIVRRYPVSSVAAVNALGGVWQNQLLRLGTDTQFGAPGQVPAAVFPNPVLAPQRMVNLTFIEALDLNLKGSDLFFGAPGQTPSAVFPNPRAMARSVSLLTHIQPLPLQLLGADKFFGAPGQAPSAVFANPTGAAASVGNRTHIQPLPLNLLGQDQFFGAPGQAPARDFPNPVARPSTAHFQAYSAYNLALLTSVAATPISNYDQTPAPRLAWQPPTQTGFYNIALHAAATPASFLQTDWPLPVRAPAVNRGIAQAPPLALTTSPTATPFNLYDWPTPPRAQAPSISLRTHLQPLPLTLLGQDQFFGAPGQSQPADFSLPVRARRTDLSFSVSLGLQTTAAPVPISNADWSIPVRSAAGVQPQPGGISPALLVQLTTPFPSGDWPNPRLARAFGYDPGPASYALQNTASAAPFAGTIWPNPVYPRRAVPDYALGRWPNWLQLIASGAFPIIVGANSRTSAAAARPGSIVIPSMGRTDNPTRR